MVVHNEKVIKKGVFNGLTHPSIKKYVCDKGELTLTLEHLSINCEGRWKKIFRNMEIDLRGHDGVLEIYSIWHRSLRFRLITDECEEWMNVFKKNRYEHMKKEMLSEEWKKRPDEWVKLLDINPKALKRVYDEIQEEMTLFRRKNLRFNWEIQRFISTLKNRKLKAYLVAHAYVAWYEWTKGLVSKIYKARFGKGPKNDKELIEFISSYPSLRILDTEQWDIKANQLRNCVAHENFYYDYRYSEVVFIIDGKEKRINLREIEWEFGFISRVYSSLHRFIKEKIDKGKISPPRYI